MMAQPCITCGQFPPDTLIKDLPPVTIRRPWTPEGVRQRKQYHHDSVFIPPHIPRISYPVMRRFEQHLVRMRRQRVLTPLQTDVMKVMLRDIGWKGRTRISQVELADDSVSSVDTVGRTQTKMEGMGLLRVHHIIRRRADGSVVQDVSMYEFIPPRELNPQIADERILTEYSVYSCIKWIEKKRKAENRRSMQDQLRADLAADRLAAQNAKRQLRAFGVGWQESG